MYQQFQRTVLDYFAAHGRDLPWRSRALHRGRGVYDPYAILVSEIMLQQTQVDRVIPKYTAWLAAWPDFDALAAAPLPQVVRLWQGLGYNRRAAALKKCAAVVVREYGGRLPRDEDRLRSLPGIGPYTAAAVRAFAYNKPAILIETNIRAVYLHHFFPDEPVVHDAQLLPHIENSLPAENPRRWYWALMDYGVHVKKMMPNPTRRSRHYTRQSKFEGSHRQVRGQVLRLLTQRNALPEQALSAELAVQPERIKTAVEDLIRDGLLERRQATLHIPKA